VIARSHSSSAALTERLFGRTVRGTVLGRRHLVFDGYVVSLTEPRASRMPNGVECDVVAGPQDLVAIGGGKIIVGARELAPGPEWDPVPSFAPLRSLPPGPEPMLGTLAGCGPGLTPAGDDLIAGYVAGLVLLHGRRERAARIAEWVAAKTTAFSATLLLHAARGEVPEPVHALLATGNPRQLLAFGHSSGHWWLRGLVSAGLPFDGLTLARSRPLGLADLEDALESLNRGT
jgi:Protein of unknown function (DUF2877)